MRTVNIFLGSDRRTVSEGEDLGRRLALHVERVFPGVSAVIVPVERVPEALADDAEIARYVDRVLYGDGPLELAEALDLRDGLVRA